MTKVDIFSGFLGAGKTTLIKKLLKEAYQGEKVVLIENEFGEIGIDGGFMQEAGIVVNEMNSGCICCSLVGDFREAIKKVIADFAPDRILIEPSGVGKLSDIVGAVEAVEGEALQINALGTVVDAGKYKMYMKNFGEFYLNQIESAGCIVLSRTGGMKEEKIRECVEALREHNAGAVIITTPWEELDGAQILSALEKRDTLTAALVSMELEHCDEEDEEEHHHHHHHHHHDEDGEEHEHHHHHHHDDDEDGEEHEHHHHHHDDDEDGEEEHEHHHHHHDDDDDDDEHEHHHHHHYDENGVCSCGHHHHHHGHDADEVFVSWGLETAKKFTENELRHILSELGHEDEYGVVLRAKGIVDAVDGQWFHFDYTPGEMEIRRGGAGITGRACVIGSALKEEAVAELFR